VHPATQEIVNNNQQKLEIIEAVARELNLTASEEKKSQVCDVPIFAKQCGIYRRHQQTLMS